MTAFGIILGLFGAALGILVGAVAVLAGMVLGLLGGSLCLLPHVLPVLLITIGIIWLVKGSRSRTAVGVKTDRGGFASPHSPGNPR
ncbi:MAG TPA: hypothetical protein VEN79_08620 [Terriglobia bacterium]|nr:hypothetical protein [Terriglobia bacterium]